MILRVPRGGRPVHRIQPMKLVYSVNETMEVLGVGRTTVYRLIGDKKLEAYKIGKKTVIKAEDLKALVDSLPKADIAPDFSRGSN